VATTICTTPLVPELVPVAVVKLTPLSGAGRVSSSTAARANSWITGEDISHCGEHIIEWLPPDHVSIVRDKAGRYVVRRRLGEM
jgi:hypothetical protein